MNQSEGTRVRPNIKVPDRYTGILILVTVGLIIVMAYKLFLQDTPPLIWDAATHFMDSVRYYFAIVQFNLPYINRYWPPLGSLFPLPAYAIFGVSPQIGTFAENGLSIVILVFALYKLSKYFGKIAAVASTFIVLTAPIILDQSITFMIDILLTATVMMTWYLLMESKGLSRRKYTVLEAVFFGLGLLAKWTFVLFVLVVLLYELAIAFGLEAKGHMVKLKHNMKAVENLALFEIVATFVAGWWYIPNLKILLNLVLYNSSVSGAIEGDPPVFTVQSTLY